MKKIYKNIVIGSGPGGAISAYHLAKASKEVLIIEAGKHTKISEIKHFSIQEMTSKYWNGGTTVCMGAPKISFVTGKCAGGGSEINSGLYHRIPRELINTWIKDFDYEHSDLESHYRENESFLNISKMPDSVIPESSKLLKDASNKLNWKCSHVPRWYKYDDDNTSIKQSMTETYLKEALNLGAQILDQTHVLKINKEDNIWKVQTATDYFLTENVFLCAGAIQTPQILLKSKVGLNVGKSLQVHPTIKMTAKFDRKVNSKIANVPVHQVKEFSPKFSIGGSISTLPYLALALADFPNYKNYCENNWESMFTYYAMITPEGKGTIYNIPFSKDPFIKYNTTEQDHKDLKTALKSLAKLLFTAGATTLFPSIPDESFIINGEDEINKLDSIDIKKSNLMTIHLFSSCPMGENLNKCTVNSYGKVHQENGLYINDGSILCSALGVNPQGGIMAIARKNILKFLEEKQ